MPRASIDPKVCNPEQCANGRCAARIVCPTKAILQFEPYDPPALVPDRCHGCSKCVSDCPQRAVRLT